MGFGFGDIIGIGGALLSGLGGGKDTSSTSAPQSGFATLPKPVQDAYLKTYLPAVLDLYNKPRQPIPMIRAPLEPASPFDSAELSKLQLFSDKVGGYFSPKGKYLDQVYPAAGAQPAANPAAAAAANTSLAQTFASLMASRGGSHSKVVSRAILSLPDDQLADLGAMIQESGGFNKAVQGAKALNDKFSAKYGSGWL
jgi:hypothetical protein